MKLILFTTVAALYFKVKSLSSLAKVSINVVFLFNIYSCVLEFCKPYDVLLNPTFLQVGGEEVKPCTY